MAQRLTVVLLLLLIVGAGGGVRPASAQSDPLRDEIQELRRTVEGLAARVESLERRSGGQPESAPAATPEAATTKPTAPAAAGNATVQEHWQRLTRGMSVAQVEALLGRPQRTVDMSPKAIWYYSYEGIGNGSVVFIKDAGVVDWQSPPFGTWW